MIRLMKKKKKKQKKKKMMKTTTAEKTHPRLVSRKKHIIIKRKTLQMSPREKKFLVHERVELHKTRSSDNSERTLPNFGYVSQTGRTLFKTIYKGFPLGLTCIVQPVLSVL